MKPFLKLKSVDEILGFIRQQPALSSEIAALDNACGRRLFSDFYAPCDLPGFARSTVDGFAVAARDVFGASETSPALLQCAPDCPMGAAPDFTLAPGQAARILTGGMLPSGADCVAMLEHSRSAGTGQIELGRAQAPGDNMVAADEDSAAGELLIPAGTLLRPQDIGCLAAFGIADIEVHRKPCVAILSTGDEVVPLSSDPAPGQVRDVNSHSLGALCGQAGGIVRQYGIIPDEPEKLRAALHVAAEDADVIVVSGGSSAGARDYTVETFLSFPDASLIAHGVAIRPGKPFILARAAGKYLLGLPGHVAGALVCGRVFLLPLLNRLEGAPALQLAPTLKAALTRSIASAQGRRDYIRCRLLEKGDRIEAEPLPASSAVISSLVRANGLIVCPENREGFGKGEVVDVEPL